MSFFETQARHTLDKVELHLINLETQRTTLISGTIGRGRS